MASHAVTSGLSAISSASAGEKQSQYPALLHQILSQSNIETLTADLNAYAQALLEESLGLVVLRPLITNFIEQIKAIKGPEVKADVGMQVVDLLAGKGAQFEEQDSQIKGIIADAYEEQGEYIKSAQILQRIPLDSTQKQLSNDDKARVWIRIVRCYLEEDDTTNAFTQLNKIKNVIHSLTDMETKLLFQLSQARMYDSQRSFLDAAQAYYNVSLEAVIDEEERLRTLSAAFVCAILAPAGPQRAKMLSKLYKDERAHQVEHFAILEKIFFDRIMSPDEVKAFASKLQPHHLAKTADGSTVLEKAVLEHNVLGVSKIYKNIHIDRLAELLGTDADKAEEYAAKMLEQGRLAGSIDQIDRWIFFEGEGSGERKTGHVETGRKELRQWDANVQGMAEEVERVATMIQRQYPEFYASQMEGAA
ncbi:COP9 signalosome-like protein complex subunit 4 [Westerdykella ornata]|uniref:COP9 signalosome complex subunit 4 n=1 Tax=Westerdykella ornata TaxID=318751 RepID=A0A6A6J8J3_WESOR|nr:COP9 signalosome-like protein complex subunit 4 [Westerdykella ornata]KAF2271956.1 COP9 signalosome-like protein complex subunit 4 [Westerdykella ornata]